MTASLTLMTKKRQSQAHHHGGEEAEAEDVDVGERPVREQMLICRGEDLQGLHKQVSI